jgi:hypothetical protein
MSGATVDILRGTCDTLLPVHAGGATKRAVDIGEEHRFHHQELIIADFHWLVGHKPRDKFGARWLRGGPIKAIVVDRGYCCGSQGPPLNWSDRSRLISDALDSSRLSERRRRQRARLLLKVS